jgi:hypothetical protein
MKNILIILMSSSLFLSCSCKAILVNNYFIKNSSIEPVKIVAFKNGIKFGEEIIILNNDSLNRYKYPGLFTLTDSLQLKVGKNNTIQINVNKIDSGNKIPDKLNLYSISNYNFSSVVKENKQCYGETNYTYEFK